MDSFGSRSPASSEQGGGDTDLDLELRALLKEVGRSFPREYAQATVGRWTVTAESVPTVNPFKTATATDASDHRPPATLSPRALAARWGVCVDKVLNFIRSGELRAFNVASTTSKRPRYRISMAEVERFEQETRATASPVQTPPEAPRRRRDSSRSGPAPKTYF